MTKKSVVDVNNLSGECRSCNRVRENGGNCTGQGFHAIPCLAYVSKIRK